MANTTRGWRRCAVALVMAASAAGLMTACGSSDDDSGPTAATAGVDSDTSSAVTEACAAVDKVTAPVTFTAPGPAVSADNVRGKTIAVILVTGVATTVQHAADGVKQAALEAGAKVTMFDGRGTPTAFNTGVEQAVAHGAAAVITIGIDPALIKDSLKTAAQRDVPVVQMISDDPSDGALPEGISAQATVDYTQMGVLRADKAICDTKGKVSAHYVYSSLAPSLLRIKEGLESEFARLCPDTCEMSTDDVPTPELATKVPPLTATAVQRNPSLNYMFPAVGVIGTFVVPKLEEIGALGKIDVSIANLDSQMRPALKSGQVTSDIYASSNWIGWAATDQVIRLLGAEEPADGAVAPMRMVTTEMMKDESLADDADIFGTEYMTEFKKLWGVE